MWPRSWEEGLIVPVKKKGDGKVVEEFRGVTITDSLYKIYTNILAERLVKEMEMKEILSKEQTGFRRKLGTIDNIYTLNYIIYKYTRVKKKKLIALFVNLKAVSDLVDREKLWEAMEKKGISEGMIKKIKRIYKETRSRVRVGSELGECFWTARGVKQECPLSLYLFNIFLSDLKDELRKG